MNLRPHKSSICCDATVWQSQTICRRNPSGSGFLPLLAHRSVTTPRSVLSPALRILSFFASLLTLLFFFFLALPAFAQVNTGLDSLTATGLGSADIRVTIANIIRIFLGLLGIIGLALALVGGFMWMTAAGNEEKIAKAKQLLFSALIGVAIILSAFALTSYIMSRLVAATGGGGGTVIEDTSGGGGIGGSAPRNSLRIQTIQPKGEQLIRNLAVRIFFSRAVDDKTLSGNITVIKSSDGVAVEGTLIADGNVVTFTPKTACPAPDASKTCFDKDADYKVEVVARGVKSLDGAALFCSVSGECKETFKSGSIVDGGKPTIAISNPEEGAFVRGDALVSIDFTANDAESAVAGAAFEVDGKKMGNALSPSGTTLLKNWSSTTYWDTKGLNPNSSHTITARAFDMDTNTSDPVTRTVRIRAAHCFNQTQDRDEESIDCGGSDCALCLGKTCSGNEQCASGACNQTTKQCVDYPTITSISPSASVPEKGFVVDGLPGDIITIFGRGFGATKGNGSVTFLGGNKIAAAPEACGAAGTWRDDRIIVTIPEGAIEGAIKVQNNGGYYDDTGDERGKKYTFIPSPATATPRPGLCSITPGRGTPGIAVVVRGVNLGTKEKGAFTIGTKDVGGTLVWTATEIRGATVPSNLSAGDVDVVVTQDKRAANTLTFAVEELAGAPQISAIDPVKGPSGTYVTIRGKNFGESGTVHFLSRADGKTEKIGETSFPQACTASYWTPTGVTVKVPSGLAAGEYDVRIAALVGTTKVESNSVLFTADTTNARPGLCRLDPDNGPAGLSVSVIGDGFGASQGTKGKVKFNAEKTDEADRQPAPITAWGNQLVTARVPLLATAGQVQLVDTTGTTSSNTLPFLIRDCRSGGACSTGNECCNDGACREAGTCEGSAPQCTFSWKFTTGTTEGGNGGPTLCPRGTIDCPSGQECIEGACQGMIPHVVEEQTCTANTQSPSPYRATNTACTNAVVAVRFTHDMQDATLEQTNNISFFQCNTGDRLKPSDCTKQVSLRFGQWIAHNTATGEGASYVSETGLLANTWYRVRLNGGAQGIMSQKGKRLDGDKDGKEGGDYVWEFRTADVPCAVDEVRVTPPRVTITNPAARQEFNAVPMKEANCNILNAGNYDWAWNVEEPKASVTVAPVRPLPATIATPGNIETAPNAPVPIKASVAAKTGDSPLPAIPEAKLFRGLLTITYPAPSVIAQWPDCQSACANAELGTTFSAPIDEVSLTQDAVKLFSCTRKECPRTELVPGPRLTSFYNTATQTLTVVPNASLRANTFWRVVLARTIRGVNTKTLSGLNFDTNDDDAATPNNTYAWVFKTKAEPATCAIDRVGVEPSARTVSIIGAPYDYGGVAFGNPDACSNVGQRLNPLAYAWQWSTSNPSLARVTNQNALPKEGTDTRVDPLQQVMGFGQQEGTQIRGSAEGKDGNGTFTLQCGFTADRECAAADPRACGGANACGVGNTTCCGIRPTIIAASPSNNEQNVCPNGVVNVTFDQSMDDATFTGNVYLVKGIVPCPLASSCDAAVRGSIESFSLGSQTVMQFIPSASLEQGTKYTFEIRGDFFDGKQSTTQKVRNRSGIALAGQQLITFETAANDCTIASVAVTIGRADKERLYQGYQDLFTCAGRDNCPDDVAKVGKAGNQHAYHAQAFDPNRRPLQATYTWAQGGDPILAALETNKAQALVTPNAQNGEADVTVVAQGKGTAAGTVGITSFICENPWPSLAQFPWTEGETNFSLFYCRDAGKPGTADDLPALYDPVPITHPAGQGCASDSECDAGFYCDTATPRTCKTTIFKDLLLPAHIQETDNNVRRSRDVQTILDAVRAYATENSNALPTTILPIAKEICKTGATSCDGLVDLSALTNGSRYLVSLPIDPTGVCDPNGVCYEIRKTADGKVTVSAPDAERGDTISVTR